jgi:hypothetical protein
MARKTLKVAALKAYVNDHLLNSQDDDHFERVALITMLERMLFDTGNYCGFRFLSRKDMQKSRFGQSFGINISDVENEKFDPSQASIWQDTDKTRVEYF